MISLNGGGTVSSTATEARTQNLTPAQKKQALNGKDLGEVLNNVADPNNVRAAQRNVGPTKKMGKEAFMTLLLTQLKNQDPTNPLESHDMAAQLAQFSSLEKLDGIDKGIKGLNKNDNKGVNFQALQLIGKSVDADSSRLIRSDETSKHDIHFKLGAEAEEVEITISNRLGEPIKKQTLTNLPKGENIFKWNGLNDESLVARKGDYRVTVKAKSGNSKIHADTRFGGKITGVNFTAEGPVLMLGESSVKMADVKKIYQENEAKPEAKVHKSENEATGEQRLADPTLKEVMAAQEGLGQVNMSNELKARISKEGARNE